MAQHGRLGMRGPKTSNPASIDSCLPWVLTGVPEYQAFRVCQKSGVFLGVEFHSTKVFM